MRQKASTEGIVNDYQLSNKETTEGKSPDLKWKLIQQVLLDLLEKHVPHKFTSSRHTRNLPWFNNALKKEYRRKRRLYKKAKKGNKDEDWIAFKQARKDMRNQLRKARYSYINTYLQENFKTNPKTWSFIKNFQKENVGVSDLKDGGNIISDSKVKANILNQQFQSVFTQETQATTDIKIHGDAYEEISSLQITAKGVEKQLKELVPSKALDQTTYRHGC